MKKMMCVLALVALTSVFGGCNVPSTETVPADTNTPVTSNAVPQNTISASGLYTNNKYGYELQLPKIDGETYESISVPNGGGSSYSEQDSDIGNINLGGNANLQISVYPKDDQKYKDIAQDNTFKKAKINDYDVLQTSGYGTAKNWFIHTIFLGEKYVYDCNFSNDTKDQKVIDMQDAILKSFKLLKGY